MPTPEKKAPPYSIVACDVFQDELREFGGDPAPWQAIEWLEMGLHDQPDNLRKEVQAAVNRLDANEAVDVIVLAYGLCGNGLAGIRAGRCPLILPRGHDCISIMLGSSQRHEAFMKKNPGAYFYSPGWIRGKRVPGPDREAHLREFYADRYGDDEEMINDLVEADRFAFAHNSCAAYVDLTGNDEAERYCRQCADHLGWQHQSLEGDPEMLRDLLAGNWDEERFLMVPPGRAVGLSNDSAIFCCDE